MALPKNYSIWLAVDYDGIEKAFWYNPLLGLWCI